MRGATILRHQRLLATRLQLQGGLRSANRSGIPQVVHCLVEVLLVLIGELGDHLREVVRCGYELVRVEALIVEGIVRVKNP